MGISFDGFAFPKPESRKRTKGRKDRVERTVRQSVRAQCVERDGYCRAAWDAWLAPADRLFAEMCNGPSEWAHLKGHRRSQTRGQAPARRHATAHSLMLCREHHALEESGWLKVKYLTALGCDGPLRFEVTR